eukprot:TRINITY_DN1166_c0_g1_i1.p1 TRINITY_DN1166_c0_g1~~TRINITY_DN1166_c0_g1_i1.p1  ORF type:complete len:202 (+),score=24.82 TRINITY_DN1166_c0_g1_i1:89-694(+)
MEHFMAGMMFSPVGATFDAQFNMLDLPDQAAVPMTLTDDSRSFGNSAASGASTPCDSERSEDISNYSGCTPRSGCTPSSEEKRSCSARRTSDDMGVPPAFAGKSTIRSDATQEERRNERRARNRQAARDSRSLRMQTVNELELQVSLLSRQLCTLQGKLPELLQENADLRAQMRDSGREPPAQSVVAELALFLQASSPPQQ